MPTFEKKTQPKPNQIEIPSLKMFPCAFSTHKLSSCEYNKKYLQSITITIDQISAASIVEKNNHKMSLFSHFLTTQNKHLQQLLLIN